MLETEYKPGDIVPDSGIYRVTHNNQHIRTHEITVIKGAPFPPCTNCGHYARFIPVREAIYVKDHPYFVK